MTIPKEVCWKSNLTLVVPALVMYVLFIWAIAAVMLLLSESPKSSTPLRLLVREIVPSIVPDTSFTVSFSILRPWSITLITGARVGGVIEESGRSIFLLLLVNGATDEFRDVSL